MSTRLFAFAGAIALSAASVSAQCLQWESTFTTQGFDGTVAALVVFQSCSGGEPSLYAGGGFTTAGGAPAAHVARWNGSAWSQVGAGLPGFVNALCAYDDGSGMALYAGGYFGIGPCGNEQGFAKWDGSTWTMICDPAVGGAIAPVYALATYDDGTGTGLYIGGFFDIVVGGQGTSDIVRFDGTGFSRLGFGARGTFTAHVAALTVFDAGSGPELVVAGEFTQPSNAIARWNGTSWSTFGSGIGGFMNKVRSVAVYDDGAGPRLCAGGGFSVAGGSNIARWTGSTWQSVGGGVDNVVHALFVFGDGTGNPASLYAGGAFSNAGGFPASRIARFDGTSWSAVGSGIDSTVSTMTSFDDHLAGGSDLYVGGTFASASGVPSPNIAQWSGCGNMPGTAFCFGDGSLATPCPCAPPDVVPSPSGAPRHGCANSFNLDGAQLFGRGSTPLDNVVLTSSGQSPAAFAFFIVGTADIVAGFATADGVRCAGGAITRFGSQFAVCGSVRYPNPAAGWTLSLSTVSGTTPGSGLTKYYQVFYRNAAAGFCTSGTANFTSGYRITW